MSSESLSREQKEAKLESLNERERRIAYRRIVKSMIIRDMAKIFELSQKTVRSYQTEMYKKLEVIGEGPLDKIKALNRDYGDLIRRFESEEDFIKWVRSKPERTIIRQTFEPVTKQPEIPPSVREVIRRQPRSEPAPPPSPVFQLPPRNLLVVMAAGVILIIFAVIIFGNNRPTSSPPEETQVSEKSAPLSYTSTIALPPSITPTPTKTLKPTNTKIPTKTFTPTITPTPFQLPFVDEFDTGIRPEWRISGDIPNVVNKTLTNLGITTMSIGLGETSLKDYIVDFKSIKFAGEDHFIGIRALDEGNMIAIRSDDHYTERWYVYFVQNGNWTQIPTTELRGCSTYDPIHFVINIKGNRLLVTLEDVCGSATTELFLSDPYRQYGGVILKFNGTTYPQDTDIIDFIRILPNP